jgi:hypothetical protein
LFGKKISTWEFRANLGDEMSKLALFLLFFVMISSAAVTRPWENASWVASNPNIFNYGIDVWWNLPEFEASLDTLPVHDHVPDTSVQTELAEAERAKSEARKNLVGCSKFSEVAHLWSVPSSSIIAVIPTFNTVVDCYSYKNNWKLAVDHSLNALELSSSLAEKTVSEARNSFDAVRFLGLCNPSFSSRPNDLCNKGSSALISYDSHLSDGSYGTFQLFLNLGSELENELVQHKPDFSSLEAMFALLWSENGTIPTFQHINNQSKEAISSAEGQYDVLRRISLERKTFVEKKISGLKQHKIHLITRSSLSHSASALGTVSEQFSSIQVQKSLLDSALHNTELLRQNIYQKEYLASAIINMNSTASNYSQLIQKSEVLLETALTAVDQQKEEAQNEILISSQQQNLNPDSVRLLQKANSSFNQGQSSQHLGTMFEHYSDAARYARMALNQRPAESKILITSALSTLEDLVLRAKKDEIDVTTEEETLLLVQSLDSFEVDAYVQAAISSIISKASLYYADDLAISRASIIEQISLAGPAAQDLLGELKRLENGRVVDGVVKIPESIGYLKQLQNHYLYLEGELKMYLAEVLSNSVSSSSKIFFSNIVLDQPTDVLMDIIINNPKDYGGKEISVPVRLSPPIHFLYSDVSAGQQHIENMYTEDDVLYLLFSEIRPFETKRISIEKQEVIAHTLSKQISAVGTGSGMAYVTEVLEFELDYYVPHHELLQDYSKTLIDGAPPTRPLEAGKHTISSEYLLEDAYTESLSNIKSYVLGTRSKIEYVLEIVPKIDLDTVPILITSANSTEISSFSMYPTTGEKLDSPKKLSDVSYLSTLHNLKAGFPSRIRVSYVVEDPASYLSSQLAVFDGLNLTSEEKSLHLQAQSLANSGNFTQAIELLEKIKLLKKEQEKEDAKARKKISLLEAKLQEERNELDLLPPDSYGSSVMSKLRARKEELELLSNTLLHANTSNKLSLLESVDFKWLSKELNSFAKSSYKEYNTLKERLYHTRNSTTPPEYLFFETALNRLQAAPNVEYAVTVAKALSEIKTIVEKEEALQQSKIDSRSLLLDKFRLELEPLLKQYSHQSSEAKGTDYSSRFTESISQVEKLLKAAESSLVETPLHFDSKFNSLNQSAKKIRLILSSLRNESASQIALLETLSYQKSLNEESRTELSRKLSTIRSIHQSGDYINSLRASSILSKSIKEVQNDDHSGLLVLGVTAIAILAALLVYLLKPKKNPVLKKVPRLGDF